MLVVLLGLCALSAARPRQSTAPTANGVEPQTLVEQLISLNDPDPTVRDAARRHILSLRVSDLPRLLQAVEALPEAAAKSAVTRLALRDALEHIHIREAKRRLIEERRTTRGLGGPYIGIAPAAEVGRAGIPLGEIWVGYVAYEVFEDGDVLVGIRTAEGLERLHHFEELISALRPLSPGDPVEFLVVRGGRLARVFLRLDERLSENDRYDEDWNRVKPEARHAAEACWAEQFVPVLKRRYGASARAAD